MSGFFGKHVLLIVNSSVATVQTTHRERLVETCSSYRRFPWRFSPRKQRWLLWRHCCALFSLGHFLNVVCIIVNLLTFSCHHCFHHGILSSMTMLRHCSSSHCLYHGFGYLPLYFLALLTWLFMSWHCLHRSVTTLFTCRTRHGY